jgi:DNA-binding NarL/FixJ family response regulator
MVSFIKHGRRHFIIGLSRPDRHLESLLSPAEVAVLKARLEGLSHQRIAHVRRTSTRTIANQIATASRRLGVTGRLETIGRLAREQMALAVLRS